MCFEEFSSEARIHWRENPKPCSKCKGPCGTSSCLEKHEHKCKGKVQFCNRPGCLKKFVESEHFEAHVCGEQKCKNCELYYTDFAQNRCFIQIKPLPAYAKKITMEQRQGMALIQSAVDTYVYDFESMFTNHEIRMKAPKPTMCYSKDGVFQVDEKSLRISKTKKGGAKRSESL